MNTYNGAHILIVEDEAKLSSLLEDYLAKEGFSSTIIERGDQVLSWLKENQVTLILLDLMLPGKDGIEVCREIREFSEIPIIMTTAKVEEVNRLLGLELGADDYICKPYYPQEVVARVKAVLRRMNKKTEINPGPSRLVLDEDLYAAKLDGESITLTRVEFRLLSILMERAGKICKRDSLVDSLHDDYRVVSDRTIDTHIKNLRKKFSDVLPEADIIRSVYGVGYIMVIPD